MQVVVAVFAMPQCGACEEYLPRFLARVAAMQKQKYPFVVYAAGTALPAGAIPVLVYDVTSDDAQLQAYANRFAVSATPTTVVQKRSGGVMKLEGGLSDGQIDSVLGLAYLHNLPPDGDAHEVAPRLPKAPLPGTHRGGPFR